MDNVQPSIRVKLKSNNHLSQEFTVDESPFVETKVVDEVEATPFFSSSTGIVLIKRGKVVNCNEMTVKDVLIEDGKITAICEDLEIPVGAMVIDAKDKFVIPGGIDTNNLSFKEWTRQCRYRMNLVAEQPWLEEPLWWWIWSFLKKEEVWWIISLHGRKLERRSHVVILPLL